MLNLGMLWFDDNPGLDLSAKVMRAAAYYASKYGCEPNVCYIHPEMLSEKNSNHIKRIEIKTSRTVLRHHYWLGVQQYST